MLAIFTYSCTIKEEPLQDSLAPMSDLALVDDGSIVDEPIVLVEGFIPDKEDFPDTKTALTITEGSGGGAKFTFVDGDRLGIFPYSPTAGVQMPFELKSSGAESAVFNCPGFSLKAGTRYAAYYPYNSTNSSYNSVAVDYTGQRQTTATTPAASTSSNFDISSADYLMAQATPSGNACSFKMSHIGALVVMDVTVGQNATYTELTLNSSSASFIQTGTLNAGQSYTQGTSANPTQGIAITSSTTSNKMTLALGSGSGLYLTAGQTYRFCMMVPPTNVTGTVTIRLEDNSNAEHIANVDTKNLRQGYAYKYTCTVDATTNLSSVSMANSYIVPMGSIDSDGYFFPTTQCGNGRECDWTSIGFTDGEGEAYPTGGGHTLSGNGVVVTLNQNNCISDVIFATNRIYFKATGNKGNAKLTLTNNGTYVWTWHIWCTNQPGTVSGIGKGNKYTVMDRNLGAYDEINYYSEEGCGLYYPFGSPIGFTVAEYTNGDEGGYRMKDAYALNPNKPFLKCGGNYMPFNSWGATDYQLPWCLLWGGGSYFNYNNYASKIGNVNTKTMYDPCPPGYKVMPYDVLDGYSNDASGANGSYYGVSITGTNGTLFLPYNGTIYRGGIRTMSVTIWGTAYTVDTRGWKVNLWTSRYWNNLCPSAYSIQMKVDNAKYENDTMNGGIYQGGGEDALSVGHGVRCVVGW